MFSLLFVLSTCASATILGAEMGGGLWIGDIWKSSMSPKNASNGEALMDENGWPMEDFHLDFDLRPTDAWAPPMPDPEQRAPWLVGVWQMRFLGNATVSTGNDPNAGNPWIVSPSVHDTSTGYTYVNLTMPRDEWKPTKDLLLLNFTNTQRSMTAPMGSGITNITLLLPNVTWADVDGGAAVTWSPWFKAAMAEAKKGRMQHGRFMGALDTNYKAGYYGDVGHHIIEWYQRSLPSDASHGYNPRGNPQSSAIPLEWVVQFASDFDQDIWINVPIAASDGCFPYGYPDCWAKNSSTYVSELAKFLHTNLPANTKVYVEHSNEVWNFGFTQYVYNKLNSVDQAQNGPLKDKDPLVSIPCGTTPTCTDQNVWAERRHLQRVFEIGQAFEREFGAGSIGTRVFPVYASWSIMPDRFNETLQWFEAWKGAGSAPKYLTHVASTSYFGYNDTKNLPPKATVSQIVAGFLNSSIHVPQDLQQIDAVAKAFGLKHASYEGSMGYRVGDETDVGNVIEAVRAPEATEIIKNWFTNYGKFYDVLHQFSFSGMYSQYGQWGATDLLEDLTTPKWKGFTTCAL